MTEKIETKINTLSKKDGEKLPFPCVICGQRFQYPQEVGDHVELAHLHPTCVCNICGKTFARPQGLLKHKRSHTGEKHYKCMYCMKAFVQWSHWRRHELTHEGAKNFQCLDCEIYFEDEKEYNEHRSTAECLNQKFECCGKDFETRDEYIDHQTKRHKRAARNREHNCQYCGKNFAYFSAKRLHEKKHLDKNGQYNPNVKFRTSSFYKRPDQKKKGGCGPGGGNQPCTCDICGEKFSNRGDMNTHRKTHPNAENSFPCNICGKVLRSKNSRYLHNLIHAGKKNHKCTYCDKRFTHRQQLRSHIRTHTNEKPYSCRFCGKKFAHPTAILPHERSHTGEKPYECSFCQKRFTRFGTWQNHVRLHTGEKPYKCKFCEKSFAQHSTWASHEKTHSGGTQNREPGVRGRPGLRSGARSRKSDSVNKVSEDMVDHDDPETHPQHAGVPTLAAPILHPDPTIQHHTPPPHHHHHQQQGHGPLTQKFEDHHWVYDMPSHTNVPASIPGIHIHNPDVYTPQIMGNWGPPP